MVLNTLEKEESVLSIDNFRWLVNSQENRSNFLNYSVESLVNIQKQAIADWEFEVAAFIRDVLSDKDKLWEINEKNNEKIEENVSDVENQLTDVLSKNDIQVQSDQKVEANESEKLDWEYVQLWKKQQSTAKEIEEYFEQNKITEDGWIKKYVTPQSVEFDWDLIKINHLRDNHFFKRENWQIKEIPIIPDKIYGDSAIRSVYKVWDYYRVELCFLNKYGRVKDNAIFNYIIDKDGNYIPELWQQTWKEKIYLNGFWCYVYDKESTDNKQILRCVYNSKMEKIAEFVDEKDTEYQKYRIQYCDDNFCICYKAIRSANPEYIIFDRTGVVWEWTKSDLQWNEYMQKYKKIEEEKEINAQKFREERARVNAIPFEERFMEKNHCKIVYNNDEKTDVSICNDKWDLLYNFWDVVGHDFNDNRPEFYTKQGDTIRLNNWSTDNNVLFIEVIKYNRGMGNSKKKSLFIDKTTWDKKEFEWFQWEYSSQFWKLAEVCYTWEDAEIYDESLNLLWNRLRSNSDFYAVSRQENWEVKSYLYSQKTWKVVCEIDWTKWSRVIKNVYEDKGWKSHYIVEQKDGTLCEVTP